MRLLLIMFIVSSASALGESRSIGHNLSTTTTVLKAKEVSVGTMFMGVGITDRWMIGVSPFVFSTYEMSNFATRYAWNISDEERILVGFEYFKTFGKESDRERMDREQCRYRVWKSGESLEARDCKRHPYYRGFNTFKMEAYDLKLTYGRQITTGYRFNLTASYFYYIDDDRPFSLRMDPQNDDRYSANLTSLHEFKVHRNLYVNLEGGFWGMNYTYPYMHFGTSLNLQSNSGNLLFGAGVSTTISPNIPDDRVREFANYDSRQSVHPEIQVQAYF